METRYENTKKPVRREKILVILHKCTKFLKIHMGLKINPEVKIQIKILDLDFFWIRIFWIYLIRSGVWINPGLD